MDKNSWMGSNGLLLQHELSEKRNSLENIPHVKEWCEKAGVNLELDVKAEYVSKVIIVDQAKAIGAYHVVLDKWAFHSIYSRSNSLTHHLLIYLMFWNFWVVSGP